MEVRLVKSFILNEKEIKEAIRKHLIDKLGTELEIKEQNIELNALVSKDDNPYDFTATLTVKTDGVQS
jgi:ribosome-associated translation inhibitor RaiA